MTQEKAAKALAELERLKKHALLNAPDWIVERAVETIRQLLEQPRVGDADAFDRLDATLKIEAIGRGKSKYAQGRRDLAQLLLPVLNDLEISQPQGDQEHRGQTPDTQRALDYFDKMCESMALDLRIKEVFDIRTAILTRTPPQTGEFVLVPRIPTDEMLKAGRDYFNECQDNAGYQAMIKAAPEQLPEVAPDNNPVQEADSEVAPPTNNECKSRDGGQHPAPASVDLAAETYMDAENAIMCLLPLAKAYAATDRGNIEVNHSLIRICEQRMVALRKLLTAKGLIG